MTTEVDASIVCSSPEAAEYLIDILRSNEGSRSEEVDILRRFLKLRRTGVELEDALKAAVVIEHTKEKS